MATTAAQGDFEKSNDISELKWRAMRESNPRPSASETSRSPITKRNLIQTIRRKSNESQGVLRRLIIPNDHTRRTQPKWKNNLLDY